MAEYLVDASGLVKRYVSETGSAWVTTLTELSTGHSCRLAGITRVEVLAALYLRLRAGTLSPGQTRQAELVFRAELATHFRLIAVHAVILDRAMNLVVRHPLRAYDAVQLATALYLRAKNLALGLPAPIFLCADKNLNRAAIAEGVTVDDPNLHP